MDNQNSVGIGSYVLIAQDNNPSNRYTGCKGTVKDIVHQTDRQEIYNTETEETVTQETEKILYLIEVDANTGDEGTCLAAHVETVQIG